MTENLNTSSSAEIIADKVKGATIFKQRCSTCHSLDSSVTGTSRGPSLNGLFGRRVAYDNSYTSYSVAAQYKDIVWNDENLSLFLTNPRKFIPGTTMLFPGIRHKQDRKDLIGYLKDAVK